MNSGRSGSPPAGESLCEREPIHLVGAIQPHGAFIAALADGLGVTHVSANLAAILGRPADAVLGRPLGEALGDAANRALSAAMSDGASGVRPVCTLGGPGGGTLHLQAHRSGRHICVDIEPNGPEVAPAPAATLVRSVLDTFRQSRGRDELCARAVQGLREITGYDRVMTYKFARDGHGEVIAEARTDRLEPYLGLRYPAGDVPAQVRRMFLRQPVSTVADAGYVPVPLLTDRMLDDGKPLDLTHSALRSVAPVHRKYMRNMKVAASLTVGLRHDQALWGMLVCHHGTPKVAGPDTRAVAEMLGQVVSLLIGGIGEAEEHAQRLQRETIFTALADRLSGSAPLHEALAASETDLLDLVAATGGIVRISEATLRLGRTPPPVAAERAFAALRAEAGGDMLAVDDLGLRHPDLACCGTEGSGALLLPLGGTADDAILWFRPELPQTVAWGGNPAEHGSVDPSTGSLSPRSSFAVWRETVRGRSAPWEEVDLALARKLREAIDAAAAQRTKQELARLRHYDPLTGLPNRSLLQERLTEAEREIRPGGSLLFLDLDRFKAVNDTMGHAAGDAMLVEVAQRMLGIAGAGNLVARLGGDEFVVLCFGLDLEVTAALAEQIREAIEAPFEIDGHQCHVSASIGIAMAETARGLDLVRAADMAMYAAKQGGGNRGLAFESSLLDRAAERFELDHDLRAALAAGDQFALLYQPLFGISSGARTLVGFEALVRWRHPRHGWMSPGQFIPLAEKSGLILPLGDWVLARALRQSLAFQQAFPEAAMRIAVNISALQLRQPGFCSGLADVLEAEGYRPQSLCLEVTETMLTDPASLSVLADVRKLGVRVAIDDFGIGHSSLSYLRRLPADVVKLDRSFLEDVEGDRAGTVFIGAVVALAHVAGKPVIFEGIETQAHFDIALAAGADVVQGFFFAPPLSANAAQDLVAQHRELHRQRSSSPKPHLRLSDAD